MGLKTASGTTGRAACLQNTHTRVLGHDCSLMISCGQNVQGFAAALYAGITKKQLDATVGIHPSSAEEFVTMTKVTRIYRGGKLTEGEPLKI